MLSKKSIGWITLSLLSFYSCGDVENRGIDSRAVKEEIRSREIKHITPSQIVSAAHRAGQVITDTLQEELTKKLVQAIEREGVVEAAQYCDISKLPATAAYTKAYGAEIKRVRLKNEPREDDLSAIEKQLLEAYQYNLNHKLPIQDNIQQVGNKHWLYTAPITLNHQVCLNCHGTVGQELKPEVYQKLKSSYAIDSLINFSANQPIAIWDVLLLQKEIILKMED